MGCDIHAFAEKRRENGTYEFQDFIPFDWRQYGLFAFLAGVRNYSAVKPIALPRGLPEDVSESVQAEFDSWGPDAHSASWLSIAELVAFDYSGEVEDRRCMKRSWEEFLGPCFMAELEKLKQLGADRIVFWFDN